MIISHKHKFIFVKTTKTAGTSIEIALSSICGEMDIITPITPVDEKTRIELGYRGAQNYMDGKFYNHIPAKKIRELAGDIWDDYYKFCFERNPWDKVISWYYWVIKDGREVTFDHFMKSGHFAKVGGAAGHDLYTDDNGMILMDDIFLYENMNEAIAEIENKLNIIFPSLPNAKSQYRSNRQPYSEVYTEQQKELVEKAFSREIKNLGYRF